MLDVIRANAQSWGVKLAFGLIIVVFVFWGVGGLTGGPTTVVINVNDQPITVQDFQRRYVQVEQNLRAQYPNVTPEEMKTMGLKRQVVQQLILEAVLTQEAQRVGLSVSPVELRRRIESFPFFQGENGTFDPKVYKTLLEAQRSSPGQFEGQLSKEMLMEKLQQEVTAGAYVSEAEARDLFMHDSERRVLEFVLFPFADYTAKAKLDDGAAKTFYDANPAGFRIPAKADVDVLRISAETLAPTLAADSAEARAYYDKNTSRFARPERVKARHIIVMAPEKASPEEEQKAKTRIDELAARIKAGEDFAELAKAHSEDGSAAEGGDLGWFERERMVKPFADAAFALKKGEVSEPLRTQFGFHLIKLDDRQDAGQTPFAEAEADIKNQLGLEKAAGKLQDVLDEMLTAVINGKSLQEAGAAYKLTAESLGALDAAELEAASGLKKADVSRVFAAEPGKVLDTPFVTSNGYVLAHVKTRTPDGVKPFDSVKDDITRQLLDEKARQLAMDDATAARAAIPAGKDAVLAANLAAKAQKSQPMGRDGALPGLGRNAQLADAAFSAEPGQWLPVAFALDGGVLLGRVAEVVPPSAETWAQVAKPLTEALSGTKREQLYRGFVATLQTQSKIQIKDDKLFID